LKLARIDDLRLCALALAQITSRATGSNAHGSAATPNEERLAPLQKDNWLRLRTSVGVAQAAIEFKMIELKQVQSTIFHVNPHGSVATPMRETAL